MHIIRSNVSISHWKILLPTNFFLRNVSLKPMFLKSESQFIDLHVYFKFSHLFLVIFFFFDPRSIIPNPLPKEDYEEVIISKKRKGTYAILSGLHYDFWWAIFWSRLDIDTNHRLSLWQPAKSAWPGTFVSPTRKTLDPQQSYHPTNVTLPLRICRGCRNWKLK